MTRSLPTRSNPAARRARRPFRLALALVVLFAAAPALGAPRDFPRPAALEKDVAFWMRIYSEVGTDGGLIHDSRDLGIVYEKTRLPQGASSKGRERHTERRKKHFKQILLKLAGGKRSGLSREEERVLALFPPDVSNKTLKASASRVRFQLGQANKFQAGIVRSGTYKPHILETLREEGLPLEIANLPHVESSYTPNVYSRVGAAGLWQFTRSTGRRFMRVDHVVDERLDPYRASIAAARLLEQNHRVTGSWPLAITAYNHGAAGMRRAARKLGTKDITTIVRKYRSRTFGFASRNFYVEFLAANAVAENPAYYFGNLVLDRPIDFETIELPYYAKANDLAKALGIDRKTLEKANPALRPTVWKGAKYVPKGFALRVPSEVLPKPLSDGIASLPRAQRHARQTRDATYTVRRGDTLSTIARRHGVRTSQLVALNGLKSRHRIRVGQKLKLPADGSASTTRKAAYKPKKKEAAKPKPPKAAAAAPALPPANGVYVVKRGDNLTRIADDYGMTVAQLVALNALPSKHRIHAGQRLRVSEKAAPKASKPAARSASAHPDASADLSPATDADPDPTLAEAEAEPPAAPSPDAPALANAETDESPIEPSPGLLADPTDYTVASNGTILVQTGETLGHFAEWLGLRASRLRKINGLRFGEPVTVQQRLRLDFSEITPEVFERVRVEYHRSLQEAFFAEWEIEGTVTHRVGPGDSLWKLSTKKYAVPIWLLRQYNPDVDLEALSAGTRLTIPKLRERNGQARRMTAGPVAG